MVRSRLARSVKERKGYKKGEYMSKLYYLKYTQESEAYVEAGSPEEAVEKITEYTSNGGSNMHNIRLNECGWWVEDEIGELEVLEDNHPNIQFDTHKVGNWTYQQQDGSQDFIYYN